MNFFKNPVVVSVLAVLAVVLVFDRVVWPLMKHGGTPQQTLATAAAVKSLPSTPSAPTAQKTAANPSGAGKMTGPRMEVATLDSNSTLWVETQRDPFHRTLGAAINQEKAYPPAAQLLQLKAIWRQSGSVLAVLNNQVLGVGDDILRFTVQSIEDDRVWVTGPNGREEVEFGLPSAPPEQTNH